MLMFLAGGSRVRQNFLPYLNGPSRRFRGPVGGNIAGIAIRVIGLCVGRIGLKGGVRFLTQNQKEEK